MLILFWKVYSINYVYCMLYDFKLLYQILNAIYIIKRVKYKLFSIFHFRMKKVK